MDRTPLTNEWTDRCVRSGHLAVTLHSQSSRKKRRDWSWKCKHRSKWRISIIVMEFFGDPIVPDGKISGTARSSYGTAGYVRKANTSIIMCGVKLLIHSQTPTLKPLKFVNGLVIHPKLSGHVIFIHSLWYGLYPNWHVRWRIFSSPFTWCVACQFSYSWSRAGTNYAVFRNTFSGLIVLAARKAPATSQW